MSQLNIKDLYDNAKKKELNKFNTFDSVLKRCHCKIKSYSTNHKTECIYEVPNFIIGTPLFDRDELQDYMISSLLKNGFIINRYPPYYIHISWDIKNKAKKKQSIKKKEEPIYKFVEDFNPTGDFINQKAMFDMKEKSIKMLGI